MVGASDALGWMADALRLGARDHVGCELVLEAADSVDGGVAGGQRQPG